MYEAGTADLWRGDEGGVGGAESPSLAGSKSPGILRTGSSREAKPVAISLCAGSRINLSLLPLVITGRRAET